VEPRAEGIHVSVCPQKAAKWIGQINTAIATRTLEKGQSQKLAGRLMWATQLLFFRIGRAMIKPIFAQKQSMRGHVKPILLDALRWWKNVLMKEVSETVQWQEVHERLCHVFVDAASTPARLAGVLFIDGDVHYFDGAPKEKLMATLQKRNDNQIMSLVCLPVSHVCYWCVWLEHVPLRRYWRSWLHCPLSHRRCESGEWCCTATTPVPN